MLLNNNLGINLTTESGCGNRPLICEEAPWPSTTTDHNDDDDDDDDDCRLSWRVRSGQWLFAMQQELFVKNRLFTFNIYSTLYVL